MQQKKLHLPGIISLVMFVLNSLLFAQGSPNVTLLKHLDDYHSDGYNDCWGYVDSNGREYALLGVQSGTSIIDITDAANAYEVEFFSSTLSKPTSITPMR
jgi:hypothetical protein